MVRFVFSTILFFCAPMLAFSQKSEGAFFKIPDMQVKIASAGAEGLNMEAPTVSLNDISPSRPKVVQVNAFEVGKQVTLREYKLFLDAMRRDFGEMYLQKLLPDSTVSTPSKYRLYMSDPAYESYPVVGVSWENAMRYCLWRSLKEHEANGTEFYYRLPKNVEWLAANAQLEGKRRGDFNQDYADWLLNAYYEHAYSFIHDLNPDVRDKEEDAESVNAKRKRYIGNSYFISFRDPASFNGHYQYKNAGLPFLGFRCVRIQQPEFNPEDILKLFKKDFGVKF